MILGFERKRFRPVSGGGSLAAARSQTQTSWIRLIQGSAVADGGGAAGNQISYHKKTRHKAA
jgi:hypothetical protein